jgi:hypothetical protein
MVPSLFPIVGLDLEGGISFKLGGEELREFPYVPMWRGTLYLLTFLLEKRRKFMPIP